MRKIVGFAVLTLTCGVGFLLSGCATGDATTYGSVQPNNKRLIVPAGSQGLTGNIKEMLHEQGWNLLVKDTSRKGVEISWKDKLKVEEYDRHPARYKLLIDQYRIVGSLYQYDISVLDLKESKEVLTMAGTGTADKILASLKEAISAK